MGVERVHLLFSKRVHSLQETIQQVNMPRAGSATASCPTCCHLVTTLHISLIVSLRARFLLLNKHHSHQSAAQPPPAVRCVSVHVVARPGVASHGAAAVRAAEPRRCLALYK